jgi:hypothetical protein
MKCANCESSLRSDFGYCPTCGAKVSRNRLTMKNVWEDVSFQVFNLDNTLIKTFRHLFSQPQNVINSYVDGIRKRYMNPISYFAIGVTLSGIMFYILRNVYHVSLTENSFSKASSEVSANMDFVFDYQGIMSYLIIPFYALFTWLLFMDKKKLNYTEHLVANAYIFGQISMLQIMVSLPLFGLFDIRYDVFNWFFLMGSVIYQFFVFKKIYKLGISGTILRAMAYLIMIFILMMGIGILFAIIGFLTGKLSLEDFAPK